MEHSEYVGRIAIGKFFAGKITEGQPVTVIDAESLHTQQKVMHIHQFHGLGRKQVSNVQAGDICAISGLDPVEIGDTIACVDKPSRLAVISVDEPTMTMTFRVNNGPFAGRDGKYVTSRQIGDRLQKELQQNVALRVEEGQSPEEFNVSGRGLMRHTFERYELMRGAIPQRKAGVMIATTTGQVTAYALDALYDRGIFFVEPGEKV